MNLYLYNFYILEIFLGKTVYMIYYSFYIISFVHTKCYKVNHFYCYAAYWYINYVQPLPPRLKIILSLLSDNFSVDCCRCLLFIKWNRKIKRYFKNSNHNTIHFGAIQIYCIALKNVIFQVFGEKLTRKLNYNMRIHDYGRII